MITTSLITLFLRNVLAVLFDYNEVIADSLAGGALADAILIPPHPPI